MNKAKLLAKSNRLATVTIDEETYRLAELSVADAREIDGHKDDTDLDKTLRLIVRSIVDDDNKAILGYDDMQALAESKSIEWIKQMGEAIVAHNKLNPDAAKKN